MKRSLGLALAPLFLVTLVGCGDATPPPQDPSSASLSGAEYAPGSHVLVSRGGMWLPGTVVRPTADGRFVVSYDGYGPQYDEPVGTDRLRAVAQPTANYQAGDKVLVTAQGRTLLADVVQVVSPTQFRVHYDGYGPEVAEVVAPDRIKRPFAGLSPHAAGESVFIDVNGTPLPAKVLAAVSETRWIVRFDGFNAQYDQEVSTDRFRAAPPPPPPPPVAAPPAPPPAEVATKDDKGKKGKKGKDKDQPKDAPPAAPPPVVAGPPKVGDPVFVNQRGAWVPATISAAGANGAWKVKYDAGGEEEVGSDRAALALGVQKNGPYTTNQPVFIEWHGMFFPAKVLKEGGAKGTYKVRYDGRGPEDDEILPKARIRPR